MMQYVLPSGQKNENTLGFIGTDDFIMLAKIILWGNLRQISILHSIQTTKNCIVNPSAIEISNAGELKLSCSAFDYISGISFKLGDPDILTSFLQEFKVEEAATANLYVPYTSSSGLNKGYGLDGSKTPEYPMEYTQLPYHPIVQQNQHIVQKDQNEDFYSPPSPPYIPSSVPSSPIDNSIVNHAAAPPSPPYIPSSPPYIPSSPPYIPSSPNQSPPRSPTKNNIKQMEQIVEEGEIFLKNVIQIKDEDL
jgi:hypothetical protein